MFLQKKSTGLKVAQKIIGLHLIPSSQLNHCFVSNKIYIYNF